MYGVSGVNISEEIALITFAKIPLNPFLISDIFDRFAQADIVIDMISQTSPVSESVGISFTCFDSDMVKVLQISKDLKGKYPQIKPMVSSGNAKIQLFGEEMRTSPGVFSKALKALSTTGVEILQITTSEVDISLLITTAQLKSAVDALSVCFKV